MRFKFQGVGEYPVTPRKVFKNFYQNKWAQTANGDHWPLVTDISQINIMTFKDQGNKEVRGEDLGEYAPKEERY